MAGEIHEKNLSPLALDKHRAISSIMEELEAVDWYNQRAEATSDPELKAILEHNRDEEKEHAAMVLEWLRRNDEVLSEQLKEYLFTSGPIVHHAGDGEGKEAASGSVAGGSLGIGKL